MPKARGSDILEKLGRVEKAAQSHKQQTKLNQQRLEWTEQARSLRRDARRLEDELRDAAEGLGFLSEMVEETQAAEQSSADVWFQVAGVRQLQAQLRRRDAKRLRQAPDQALSLQAILGSVSAAAAELERECGTLRGSLRRELAAEGLGSASGERAAEDRCDLSDEEDALLERVGDDPEGYEAELQSLNAQVSAELGQLEQELLELRRKRAGWNDEAHFRFLHIKREFQGQGKSRELMADRLSLEFPHLSREQLQQHEALCDAVKYSTQRQAAAFRQWRRERFALLRRHQARQEDRRRTEEAQLLRRQEMLEVKERGRQLQGRLQVERVKATAKREEQQRARADSTRRREAAEAEREQLRNQRAQQVKELSKEQAEKRREQQQRQQEEAAEQERREAEERARRIERNAEIVKMRRQMDEIKQREAAQKRAEAEQERREQALRLEMAMEKLKVEAPRDPERLLKVPSRASAEAYADPLVCVTRGPHAGFDEKRLMADARYKLSAALQAAGLFETRAGHEALRVVAAPRPAQPHIVSQVFAGGYPGS
eukprot:TRINITY_DN18762_c0_g1_i3.p1 TRINITY_DN18762_c0_g1~~TRINITY_DN18762_c0_g1_i3.p1  ORF type:complete len:545 (-),score=178.84 TRINITY_DN18762_c0_g1_i3:127-1761(-)